MEKCRIVKHALSIEYNCPVKKVKHSVKIINPNISEGSYFSDWTYTYVHFKCELCGEYHSFEI